MQLAMIRPKETHSPTIYADYQASTPLDKRVAQNIAKYFEEQIANPHSHDHVLGWKAAEQISEARHRVAGVIGADSDEIVFTSGATEANNLVLLGLASRASSKRRRILVSSIEHKSVLAAAFAAARYGCLMELIPVDSAGRVQMDALELLLDDSVLAVSVGLVNNEIGTRQPLAEIVHIAERHGAFVHSDTAQALTDGPIDVSELGVSAVSLSAHKIYGPQGIGAVYIRRDQRQLIDPRTFGGGQQDGLRPGTLPTALCRGFADAAELSVGAEAENDRRRVRMLRDTFVDRLVADSRVALNGPSLEDRHPGNCNLGFRGEDGSDLLGRLQPHLAASTGSACTSGTPEPSHVLTAIGLSSDQARSSIRFSFGRFTTQAEVDRAAELVLEALRSSEAARRVA